MSDLLANIANSTTLAATAAIASNITTTTLAPIAASISDALDLDILQNYSVLINKLEKLALGVDSTLGNISVDHKEFEISLSNSDAMDLLGDPIASSRAGPPRVTYAKGLDEADYSRVVSDIWIGIILTLLIVSVIFFICACFLYHKFQQWKNSYRTNNAEPVEVCRNCPPNYEVESLPSYTIVSGLPTYDDAIEEFRKAGIILTPPIPIIKIFESKDSKDILNIESGNNEGDNVSLNSTNNCTCGANSNNTTITSNNNNLLLTPTTNNTQFIELSPEQLSQLSQKRLSLQIAFPQVPQISGQFRRHSRPRIDMRNNLLRSRIGNVPAYEGLPEIHRSSSTFSLANEQRNINMALHMQHRGSLF
ncbi:comm3 isoform X1 [Musca autumnalis]|uniref:comm3 isoform X1 n=1 Tax=Musca autumnalis TaxID=221902 RepID=UPI003CEAE085